MNLKVNNETLMVFGAGLVAGMIISNLKVSVGVGSPYPNPPRYFHRNGCYNAQCERKFSPHHCNISA